MNQWMKERNEGMKGEKKEGSNEAKYLGRKRGRMGGRMGGKGGKKINSDGEEKKMSGR